MPPELQRPLKPTWMQPNQTAGKRVLNFGKEIIDKTGKGMSMISSGIDNVAGLPGRIATGFNPNVPKGFSEQVGQATEGLTGNRTLGNVAGFAAGMAEPMGMPGKAAKVLSKAPNLSQKGYQTIIDYLDHTEGINKLTGDAAKTLKYNAQVIAEKLGMDSTGGDVQLANKLRQHLDMQGSVTPKPIATVVQKAIKKNALPDEKAIMGQYLDHVYGIKKLSPEKLDYVDSRISHISKKLGINSGDKYQVAMKIGEYLDSQPRMSRSLTP